MIGLDTNVLVRYVVQDDPAQSAIATKLIETRLSQDSPGFVTAVTLCELVWVLTDCYAADRAKIGTVIEALLATRQIRVERADLAWRALRSWGATAADFSDALIGEIVADYDGEKTVTFDRKAAKLPGFELLQ